MKELFKDQNAVSRFSVLVLFIVLVSIYRLLPHPWNLAPVGAMALFGGAYFSNKLAAFLVPLISLWVSDIILNNLIFSQYFNGFTLFYDGFVWQYSSFLAITLLGMTLQNRVKPITLLGASLAGSLFFYLISNFGVWASGTMYPANFSGLVSCYVAGLPFLKPTVLGDLVFNIVLFGSFEFLQSRFPKLKIAK